MKPWLRRGRQNRYSSIRQKILWVGCAIGLLAGCSKHVARSSTATEPPPVDTTTTQSAPESQPVTATPAPAMAATNAAPDLRELNGALVSWILQNHRRPASVEDYVASSGVRLPPPPTGKKYALNPRGLIILVNAN